MTVKELKEFLADKDDKAEVWFQYMGINDIFHNLTEFNFLFWRRD